MAHSDSGASGSSDCQISYKQEYDSDLALFTEIDDPTKLWLNSLHYIWGLWKKSDGITKTLTDYFDSAPNPYLSTLRIVVNTSDFNHVKTKASLAFTVMEEFCKWISVRRDIYTECLVPDLKVVAFKLVSRQKNMQLLKVVCDAYQVVEHKELILSIVQDVVKEKKFKEAAQYAAMLHLQSYFADPETILMALVLQCKVTVVEDFLAGCPDIQRALVMYLDNLIAPGKNMQNMLERYICSHDITGVKMSTIQVRPMTKLVARLTKIYNLPPDVCPNLNQRRGEGALQFLVHKRFIDGTLSGESWREMVREAVGTDEKLQLELVKQVTHMGDLEEALYWAKTYNIPKQEWPWSLSDMEEQNLGHDDMAASNNTEENWDIQEESQYHVLSLPRDCIKLVDNPKAFEEFLDEGLRGVTTVGIDSEWKPSFGTKRTELALIQIATESDIFILDVTTMGNNFTEMWTELGLVLFENKSIVKLGFGLAHDVAMMRESLPALSNVRACGQGYLDLLHLWRKLVQEYNFQFPYKGDETFTNESLSKLVELCVGHRLDKSDQFSNWERRPLRESQITYAALDAYCLLEVFAALGTQAERKGVPFQEICAEVQHIAHKSPKKQSKKSSGHMSAAGSSHTSGDGVEFVNETRNRRRSDHRSTAIPAHEWHVVCDSMLGGLARQLRMCGCDCIYVEYDRGGDQSARLAMQEDRVLLTRGGAYHRFVQYVPPGNCYRVCSDRPENQLKEVLSRFNILVTRRDIFSRCQICNHDEFVQVSKNRMNELNRNNSRTFQSKFYRVPGNSSMNMNTNVSTNMNMNMNYCSPSVYEVVTDYEQIPNDDFRPLKTNPIRYNNDRTWHLSIDTIDVVNCTTKYGVRVQIDRVPINVLRNVQRFYVCEYCGKVYWDGSHMERALSVVLRDVIVRE
ncbi:exonuclease mut-7 homolog [Cephus cinctus]|uniref:Exonuclease mut-7 homolog n=1 Tax=Cephus cinctus TaxID=211228 RepID=A0AAJ7BHL0_CEPCN|nr:exonuclease mut-7 homolog [Cephus cinctus]